MSVDITVNTTETNVNINASTIVETVDITATVQQDAVEIEVFPNVTIVNVTKKVGTDGQDGTNGVDGVDGTDGQDLTLEDFNVVEETTTLVNSDEFLVKKDGVWKKITKENLITTLVIAKSKSVEFIMTAFAFSVANTWYGWSQASGFGSNFGKTYGTGTLPTTNGTLYSDSFAYYLKNAGTLKRVTVNGRYVPYIGNLTMYMITANNKDRNRGEETEMQVIINDTIIMRQNNEIPATTFNQSLYKSWNVDIEFSENAIIQLFFKSDVVATGSQGMFINLEFE